MTTYQSRGVRPDRTGQTDDGIGEGDGEGTVNHTLCLQILTLWILTVYTNHIICDAEAEFINTTSSATDTDMLQRDRILRIILIKYFASEEILRNIFIMSIFGQTTI